MLDIGWPADLTWYRLLTDWGSLIGGFFALIAGAALYVIGRVQVRATTEAADREIAAAQEQTKAARDQIATTQPMEQHRIARESYAFLATLEAAMGAVLEGVEAARVKFANENSEGGHSAMAYAARQEIKKAAFGDLRSACLRLGGQLTAPFLHLDNDIDVFAAQWTGIPSTTGTPIPMGANAGLLDHLARIEAQAVYLRNEATDGMKRCIARLQETQDPDLANGHSQAVRAD